MFWVPDAVSDFRNKTRVCPWLVTVGSTVGSAAHHWSPQQFYSPWTLAPKTTKQHWATMYLWIWAHPWLCYQNVSKLQQSFCYQSSKHCHLVLLCLLSWTVNVSRNSLCVSVRLKWLFVLVLCLCAFFFCTCASTSEAQRNKELRHLKPFLEVLVQQGKHFLGMEEDETCGYEPQPTPPSTSLFFFSFSFLHLQPQHYELAETALLYLKICLEQFCKTMFKIVRQLVFSFNRPCTGLVCSGVV